jgi:transposase
VSQHRVWKRLVGVEHTVITGVELEGEWLDERVVVRVRPTRSRQGRCSQCFRRCRGYDQGGGRRRWRAVDLGSVIVELEADAPRVRCRSHGVVVALVPWARPGARFTHAFEDTCAWLAARTAASTVAELLRVTWRTVTGIVERVVGDALDGADLLDGVTRVGIDEIAHRKGHRYLTAVTDHDTGRLIWAAPGRDQATVEAFFDALGPERAARITHVSADGAEWIHAAVRSKAPQAVICLDAFHVVAWATKALDEVRRQLGNTLRRAGAHDAAAGLKGSRWALVKNPEDLTPLQRGTLAGLAQTNRGVYRAYLIKEQLRAVFHTKGDHGRRLLAGVISWAARSRLEPMVKLSRTLTRYRPLIEATLTHGLSNARSEATNVHLRVLTRRSYGFHSPEALIAMALLTRGGLCPDLPGRAA